MIVTDSSEIDAQIDVVNASAQKAVGELRELCRLAPMEMLWRVKFKEIGFHPIEDRRINLIEQLNQTWTYVAALEAARILLVKHPTSGAMSLAPGAHFSQPLDIMSGDGKVGAEVFAVVDPKSNEKLKRDRAKLASKTRDDLKLYIFFMSPRRFPMTGKLPEKHQIPGMEAWSLAKPIWME